MAGGVEQPPRKEERDLIKGYVDKEMEKGDTWFVLGKWWRTWMKYVKYTSVRSLLGSNDEDDLSSEMSDLDVSDRPGPIDCSDIQDEHFPEEIRRPVQANDIEFIHEDGYKLLKAWYGLDGPEFPRKVISVGGVHTERRVDLYPNFITVEVCDAATGLPQTSSSARLRLTLADNENLDVLEELCLQALDPESYKSDYERKVATEGQGEGDATADSSEDEIAEVRLWYQDVYSDEKQREHAGAPPPDLVVSFGQGAGNNGSVADEGEGENSAILHMGLDDDDIGMSDSWDHAEFEGEAGDEGMPPIDVFEEPQNDPFDDLAAEAALRDGGIGGGGHLTVSDDEQDADGDGWEIVPEAELKINFETLKNKYHRFMVEIKPPGGKWARDHVAREWGDFRVGDIIDCKDSTQKWYESEIKDVQLGDRGLFVHYINWPPKWDEWIKFPNEDRIAPRGTHTVGPYVPQSRTVGTYSSSRWNYYENEEGTPKARGVVGLRNMGNTCFMNSTLQCLSNSSLLTEYFLTDKYQGDINTDNPLGWQGKIAESYGALVKELWGDQFKVVAPTEFKKRIGELQPRFSGYQQQDSHELLTFLLDGLHEDLNTIKKKPMTDKVEANGRHDSEVAKEAWDTHLLRNKSVIVDMFQAQLKSTIICPTCRYVSVTFDPYNYLSVPLPTEKNKAQRLIYVSNDPDSRPVLMAPKAPKLGMIKDLKGIVGEINGVQPENQVVCDVWRHKMFKMFRNHDLIAELHDNDAIYVYEVPNGNPEELIAAAEAAENPQKASPRSAESGSAEGEDEPASTGATAAPASVSVEVDDAPEDSDDAIMGGALEPLITVDGPRAEGEVDAMDLESGQGDSFSSNMVSSPSSSLSSPTAPDGVYFAATGYHYAAQPKKHDHKLAACVIFHRHEVISNWNDRITTEEFGLPQVIKLPKNCTIPFEYLVKQIRTVLGPFVSPEVFDLAKPPVYSDLPFKILFRDFRGARCARCPYTSRCLGCVLSHDTPINIRDGRVAFSLDWDSTREYVYQIDKYFRPLRDPSAKKLRQLGTALSDLRPVTKADLEREAAEAAAKAEAQQQQQQKQQQGGDGEDGPAEEGEASVQRQGDNGDVDLGEGGGENGYEAESEDGAAGDDDWDANDQFSLSSWTGAGPFAGMGAMGMGLGAMGMGTHQSRPSAPDDDDSDDDDAAADALNKPVILDDCIASYCVKETLAAQDAWYCRQCKEHKEATKKLELWNIPDICVIHLKRFQQVGDWREKIDLHVDFPLEGLDFRQWVVDKDFDGELYDLYAVSNHMGGLGGGHYTAYALNPINHTWYEFDDADTRPVSDPQASIVSPKAYVLFYMKRSLLNKLKTRARSANLPDKDAALPLSDDDVSDDVGGSGSGVGERAHRNGGTAGGHVGV